MKLKSLLFAALLATSTAAFAAEPAPLTLNGVLTSGNTQHFGLVNENATRSDWVKIGDQFDGYTLKSYDAPSRTLTLEREGKPYTVSLTGGKLGEAAAVAGTKATLADAEAVFTAMQIEDMLGQTMKRSLVSQNKMVVAQMEKQLGGKVSPEDAAKFQEQLVDAMLAAMNPEQMKKDMVQIYAESFTKEELAAMAAFHSTPTGKSMVAKQPEIQGRVQELMLPRMAAAMPEIAQLRKEFVQQQKAKINAQKEAAQPAGATPPASTDAATPAKP